MSGPVADSYDVMGEGSFPASDPPAVWTWEVERKEPAKSDEPRPEGARTSASPPHTGD